MLQKRLTEGHGLHKPEEALDGLKLNLLGRHDWPTLRFRNSEFFGFSHRLALLFVLGR